MSLKWVVLTSHWYTVWWGGLMGLMFFCTQVYAVSKGLTPYEMSRPSLAKCTASVAKNFRDVFGDFWFMNFIFPAVLVFRQAGDGKSWEKLKRNMKEKEKVKKKYIKTREMQNNNSGPGENTLKICKKVTKICYKYFSNELRL